MIFNLFKSKPTLKELIPKGSIDIHSHILPKIDDGAKNVKESLKIIRKLKEIGYEKIFCTPHIYPGLYENSNESISKSYNSLKPEIPIDIEIEYASEYLLGNYMTKTPFDSSLITLKDKYVLVEMSYLNPPQNIESILFKICLYGYKPILAHPERYRYFFGNNKIYKKLKRFGCAFQINLFSTIGFYGKDVLKCSEKLLNENMIDFVGTDIHNSSQLELFEKKIRINSNKKLIKALVNTNVTFK